MCEANVYIVRNGQEELLMEKVDRLTPGDENNIFMQNIFGERKEVQAKIKDLELVHHRIILDEIQSQTTRPDQEMWINLNTEHGHFHAGEAISLNLFKGYNMKADQEAAFSAPQVFVADHGQKKEYPVTLMDGKGVVNLGDEADGLLQIFARERVDKELYATIWAEVGHHHHHGIEALGLPLEILPTKDQHARMGENYEIQVLKDGRPMTGTKVRVTYAATSSPDYPHQLITDEEGKAHIFLSARGDYLFSVCHEKIISTFTLVKSF